VSEQSRRYERLEVELPVRLYIPEAGAGPGTLRFQAFCTSRNLGLGGLFVASSFLLPEGLELHVELGLPDGPLSIRSRVAHVVALDDERLLSGLGIEFLDVDAQGRETLLRSFTPPRYQAFFDGLLQEFPHLKKRVPLQDVSFLLNLWEEWKIRQEGGPALTASGAPPAPHRRPGEAPVLPPQRPARRRPAR
jgi:PilZ domain